MSLRRRTALAMLAAAALALAACSSGTEVPRARQSSANTPFTGCDKVACTGAIHEAPYQILMPKTWNGTLLLYSHGYRNAQPAPPDFAPVSTTPEPAPGYGEGHHDVADALLAQGYALAGSAYKSNGWAVSDGVAAAEDLYQFFKANVGDPYRVYVWGDSLGGLITQTLAEKDSSWIDGAAPLCGVLGGVNANLDLGLDVEFAIKTLLYPQMKLTNYASYQEAVQTFEEAAKRLIAAASDVKGGGTAKVLYIASLIDAPSQSVTYDGASVESRVKATVESVATSLGTATFARYDVEQRYGGNPSSNVGVDYAARISDSDRALVDAVTPGAAERYTALLAAAPRVAADPGVRDKAAKDGGDPQGDVTDPTITLHTAADPLVLVQNESFFQQRYQAATKAGKATAPLVQLYTTPPATYAESAGAPYGAGHCNFTTSSRVAVVDLLDEWVRNGVYPGDAAIQAAMGTSSGYTPGYSPGPWPEPAEVTAG